MCHLKRVSALLVLFIFLMSACNLPTAQGGAPNLQATITAQALLLQGSGNQPAGIPGETATPSLTPTITPTFTPSVPTVTVSQDTNCRSGPSKDYDYLAVLHVGESAEVIGKNTATNYWIVKIGGVICWLWGQYATVSGNVSVLTEYIIPATSTPSVPAAPSDFKVHISCTLAGFVQHVHINLTWTDNATNEQGYKVYRDDGLLTTLGPDETSYSDETTLPAIYVIGDPPPSVTYGLTVFNSAGKAKAKDKTVSCP